MKKKLGLCLSGGGITGAMYQVGAIAALADASPDFRMEDIGIFVGSSTGAVVAALLAGGLPPLRLYRALLDPADDFFPLGREHVLKLDTDEWKRSSMSALLAARRLFLSITSAPLQANLWNELDRFWDSLPAGIFDLHPFEIFLDEFFERRSIPRHFDAFSQKLVVVASDLDAGSRALFGENELRTVSVAKALTAAVAVPLLYSPYRVLGRDYIEGGAGDMNHVDIAYANGAELILAINPNVPVRAHLDGKSIPTGHGKGRGVRDKGALWVYDQAWRMRTEMRLRKGIDHFSSEHPEISVVLLEPNAEDVTMFMHSPMNFAARRAILENAYTLTRQELRNPASALARAFQSFGFRLEP